MSFVSPSASRGSTSPEVSLPLDWTQVQRKRPTATAGGEQCCEDSATCRARHRPRPRLNTTSDGSSSPASKTIQGQVVFCLHEIDPSWFQGYFIPAGSRQPWGLLAVQEEIEDCLACADGGFRQISLTIYPPSASPSSKPIKLETIDWTGGDMIQLQHEGLEVEADRILTGNSSSPYIDRFFKGLVKKLRTEYDASGDASLLDFLPDVAVVLGTMTLVLPVTTTGRGDELDG